MIYHIVVGDMAAEPIQEAINEEESMAGEVVVLRDILHIGPLKRGENQSFSSLRTDYWKKVVNNENQEINVDDQERLLKVITQLRHNEDDVVWLWMAPWPADVCAYYWILSHMTEFLERYHVLNLAGLPFLDEEGKVYYPKNISQILPKELKKARKLARQVTTAELEVDGEEWENMVLENSGIRVLEGGKKILCKPADHYDNALISFCSQQFQKAHRIVGQAIKKLGIPTADTHLGWRLRKMAEQETLKLEGDISKTLKDFSVKLPSGLLIEDEQETPIESEAS